MERESLDSLLGVLQARGFTVIGPTVRDGAIVLDRIEEMADLPRGLSDEQDGGTYRLVDRDDDALFGYVAGPRSWKHFLHPPRIALWRAQRNNGEIEIREEPDEPPRYAFLGVRSCDLHAIAIQDRVMMEGEHPDPHYVSRREGAFIIAINCGEAGGTCFCVSMGTGPRADKGYDLALTEIIDEGRHYFTVEVGSERVTAVMAEIA